MPNTSNNYDIFLGSTSTNSNNANAFPITTSVGPTYVSTWNTIEDYDWSTQTTSAILTGAGSLSMGGKTVTNALVGSTPTYTSQVINGQGLVFTCTALAGSGGASFRFDLPVASFNPGEEILLEMLFSSVSYVANGTQHLWGIGSSGHYSQGEWHGVNPQSTTLNTVATHQARGFSTTGGARTVNLSTAQPLSTDYIAQVWFDGSYSSRVAMLEAQTTFLSQPVIGNAAPFNALLDVGITGTGGSVAPATSLNGVFSSTLRCICGVGTQNGSFTLKRHRISRVTRM